MGNIDYIHLIQICLHLRYKQHKQMLRILKDKARIAKEPCKLDQEVRKLPEVSGMTDAFLSSFNYCVCAGWSYTP